MDKVIQACNKVSSLCGDRKGPQLGSNPTASEIMAWLKWADRDGDYDYIKTQQEADDQLVAYWDAEDILYWRNK